MFLVTTANQNFWKTGEKILFLGEWCKLYDQKHIWSKLDYETLPSHWEDTERLNHRYTYMDNIYEKYLSCLTLTLNNYHGEDNSEKYWRIILGPWLSIFIGVIFDRYLSIKTVINSKKDTHTWIPPLDIDQWVPLDTLNFSARASEDINFNLFLYSQILFRLEKIPFEIKRGCEFSELKVQEGTQSQGIFGRFKRTTKRLLGKLLSKTPDHYKQIVFFESGLSIGDFLKLNFLLGKISCLVPKKDSAPFIASIQKDRRKNLKLPQSSDEFESLLNEMLSKLIPMSFLENYLELRKFSLDTFPKNPKVIVTSYAQTYNESFKFWAATQTDKGAKLVINQHGGGYGYIDTLITENHEIKICDKYFTWGWIYKGNPKIIQMPVLKLSNRNYNIKPNKKGAILWVTATYPIHLLRLDHFKAGYVGEEYFIRQKRFLEGVNSKVFESLIMRLYKLEYGWKEKDRLADLVNRTPKFYRGEESLLSQIKKSRLCIHDYLGTSWLETLSMNFPTVIFWDPAHIKIRKSAMPYMDDLRAAKIFHDTPESAAKLINEIYNDPMFWWMEPQRQKVRKKFCYQFSRKSKNGLKEWKNELLKTVKGDALVKENSNNF